MSDSTPGSKPSAQPKRHLKNFLLDKKFQLTYALIMVFAAIIITGLLGYLVFRQTREASQVHERQANETINMYQKQSDEIIYVFDKQSADTKRVFKEESDETKQVFESKTKEITDQLELMKVDPTLKEMVETVQEMMRKEDKELIAEREKQIDSKRDELDKGIKAGREEKQKQLREALTKLQRDKAEASTIRRKNNQRILIGVVLFSILFVVLLFMYTIVLTHKVAGPLFKIARYLERLEHNDLGPVWPLRKGDQLQEFYGKFEKAHHAIVDRCKKDIEVLEAVLADMPEGEGRNKLAELKELKEKSLNPPKS